eukprot:Clim_evm19s13 gene=Clim_evmTU19s13
MSEQPASEQSPLLAPQRRRSAESNDSGYGADDNGTEIQLTETYTRKSTFKGLMFMTLSAVGFSSMTLFVKLASTYGFQSMQLVFARSVVQLVLALIVCIGLQVNPFGNRGYRLIIAVRGAVGALGLAGFYFAITVMPMGDATVLFFMGPVFVGIFAAVFLGEAYHATEVFCSFLSLVGVAFVARPPFIFKHIPGYGDPELGGSRTTLELWGAGAALLGAVGAASAYTIVRYMGTRTHFMVSVFSFGLVSTILSAPAALIQGAKVPVGPVEWTYMIMIGLSAFVGQCLLNAGLQLAKAGPGTVMRNLDVVIAYIFQVTILHEKLVIFSVIGAVLITSSVVIIPVHKWYVDRREARRAMDEETAVTEDLDDSDETRPLRS